MKVSLAEPRGQELQLGQTHTHSPHPVAPQEQELQFSALGRLGLAAESAQTNPEQRMGQEEQW